MRVPISRRGFVGGFAAAFALVVAQADAFYYNKHVKTIRMNERKMQPGEDPSVVGNMVNDKEGHVIVRWMMSSINGRRLPDDTLVPGKYRNEAAFIKAYIDKCEARADKSADGRVLGAVSARRSAFTRIGKKIWAAHVETMRSVRPRPAPRPVPKAVPVQRPIQSFVE